MAVPQVFVSHSHADNDYCRAFVEALRHTLGDDDAVWYDEHNLGWGALRRVIEEELRKCQHFIAILSPAAVASEWVNDEIDAARTLRRKGSIQTIQFVTADPCEVPLLLEGYMRIEQAGGQPYPPAAAAMRACRVIVGDRVPPPPPPPPPPPDRLPPLGPAPPPAKSTPALHLTPTRLHNLGYRGYSIAGVECIVPPICPVPGGVFTMGSDTARDKEARDSEMPQYPVAVDGFAIGQHPVTVAEYACAVRANVVREPPKGYPDVDWAKQLTHPDHPVVCVSWKDVMTYSNWLAKLTGQPWRLPSEAEWEKAARGEDGRIYPWGDAFEKSRCNTRESGIGTTSAVGIYPTGESPYRAQDMAGNVWEWTSSLYQSYPYRKNDGREKPDPTENRVLRGGSWGSIPRGASVSDRFRRPDNFGDFVGFRLAWAAGG